MDCQMAERFKTARHVMVLIRVEYDAYNRRFKLIDRDLARLLEDGEQYLLIASIAASELESQDSPAFAEASRS
jgi:hypothetical protein